MTRILLAVSALAFTAGMASAQTEAGLFGAGAGVTGVATVGAIAAVATVTIVASDDDSTATTTGSE